MLRFPPMALRAYRVLVTSVSGVQHSVEVTADSLYEAAALGLRLLQRNGWVDAAGPATRLEVEVSEPVVKHQVTVQQIQRWMDSTAVTPEDRVKKNRVRDLLTK
jgi:hypothetical protein